MKRKYLIIGTLIFVFIIFFTASNIQAVEIVPEIIDTNKVTCGTITGIPEKIPEITRTIVTLVQIAVPIVLVVVGMMDLFKGLAAQKEDEVKKGRQMFVKRLIIGAIIFFVIAITRLLVSVIADDKSGTIECIDCFLSDSNSCTKEYRYEIRNAE